MSEFTGDSFGQLEDIYGQTVEMQRFVQNAYEMNTNTFLERTKIVEGLWAWVTAAAAIIFVILAISRGVLVMRLKKMLKAKKLI